jgi:acetyl-CoA C-acetyltransferase
MTGKSLDDIGIFDIYSCFPSAIEIACEEIGLSEDDPRGLTVTGGLPYSGGPGNSYVLHSISDDPARGEFGLVSANGIALRNISGAFIRPYPTRVHGNARIQRSCKRSSMRFQKRPSRRRREARSAYRNLQDYVYGKLGPEIGIVVGRRPIAGSCPTCRATPRL